MNPDYLRPVAEHLWQSTIFAGVVGLLTVALRRNRARLRHWLWLAVSCKFLIPLSVLTALGAQLAWWTPSASKQSSFYVVMEEVGRTLSAPAISSPLLPSQPPAARGLYPAVLLIIWICGFIGIAFCWWIRWRGILTAVRSGSPVQLGIPIPARSSPTLLEPGIFGIYRPVLLLPVGIFDRLSPTQLQAVIAHELCHLRYRDNLTAAIQMFIETVFWFYPLVWWIGKRIVAEREHDCDEAVLRLGIQPQVYAEGILNVCKFYLESPLACVSGITGSNLKARIRKIMNYQASNNLDWGRKVLLSAVSFAAVAGPITFGFTCAAPSQAQSQGAATSPSAFEVASVKPNKSATGRNSMDRAPGGGFTATNVTLRMLLKAAYSIHDYELPGGPGWIDSERYDIVAKAPPNTPNNRLAPMLQALLADRFKLAVHRETRELPVYALMVGKDGPKIHEVDREPKEGDGDSRKGRGRVSAQRVHLS